MYDAIDDPYTYENSTVLVNKLDLRDQHELDDYEAEISNARSEEPLPEGELDFSHYCAVHHHLFQDVYDWAGRPRTVLISKQGNPFCFPEHIEARHPLVLARRADDPGVERAQKGMHPSMSTRSRARKYRWCMPTRCCSKSAPSCSSDGAPIPTAIRPPTQ
jgi:cell filamentation protein